MSAPKSVMKFRKSQGKSYVEFTSNVDAAKYYLDAAATEVSANNGGSARGSGGVTVTQSPSDDWMNWKGTGHSATWNRNNNPDFWSLANNGEAA